MDYDRIFRCLQARAFVILGTVVALAIFGCFHPT
jgi:hypothetical protein